MFQKGDLLWIPANTVLLVSQPNNPQAMRITSKPEVGVFMNDTEEDKDFCELVSDGRHWVTNKKNIKHLRRDYVS